MSLSANLNSVICPPSLTSTCNSINNGRTITDIIWSCFSTICICIWVGVHPNMPKPQVQSWRQQFYHLLERVGVSVLALLAPEFILVWAIRQWFVARWLARKFQKAHGGPVSKPVPPVWKRIWLALIDYLLCRRRRQDEKSVLAQIERNTPDKKNNFIPPSEYEINDKSKNNVFSKTIVLIQTLWFVAQCLARWIQDITVTEFETVTFAYTLIIVLMYLAWWNKPLRIDQPMRIQDPPLAPLDPGAAPLDPDTPLNAAAPVPSVPAAEPSWKAIFKKWHDIFLGKHDTHVDLHNENKVPVFYAGEPHEYELALADFFASIIAIFFGAIHFAAWSSTFPSRAEQLLWRISTTVVVGGPGIWVLFFTLTIWRGWETEGQWMEWEVATEETEGRVMALMRRLRRPPVIEVMGSILPGVGNVPDRQWMKKREKQRERVLRIPRYLSIAVIPVYIIARAVLLTLAFTTLRSLPQTAYQTTWTAFIPHI